MTVAASELIRRAGVILGDESYVRWTLPELCGWLNEGCKAIVLAKPSAKSSSVILTLQAGTLQVLPADYLALLRLNRNLKTNAESPRVGGRMIRPTTRDLLDAAAPYWHDPAKTPYRAEVRQFIYDNENPREFYVYPGNNGSGIVEAVVSEAPATITATGATDEIGSYATNIDLDDVWEAPIVDYIVYRAYLKDETYAAQGSRAQMHFGQFAQAVGIKQQVETNTSPNTDARIAGT
jgi:hypothetical protein